MPFSVLVSSGYKMTRSYVEKILKIPHKYTHTHTHTQVCMHKLWKQISKFSKVAA